MSIDELDWTQEQDETLAEEATEEEVKLPGKECKVTMFSGQSFAVRITNREFIAWDKTAPRKKWGKTSEVPFLATTFMAWVAAKREHKTTMSWDQWQLEVAECESRDDEPEDLVGPTREAPQPGTS